ncbi:hypothetical protein MUK60_10515 [Streptomyces sp. LRE541]|uniref:hypothetical protein n=1 Tax=Streptomyces sp. LRE541 TaxID=2931983 RepID=UPI00200FF8A9|nr:hypothetical protein [Streptomyces sp. LRE541]UPZ28209.1 hypothetical protein MUK60_10515 [Streptomyces sp. LRE541]
MTAGWGVRTVRAAVFAVVCVVLAALGHVLMSGSPVAWWTMAAGTVATCGAGWCLAGRERGLPLIVSVVVVTQGLLHWSFSLAASMAGPVASGRGTGAAHMSSVDAMTPMDAMDMGSMSSMGSGRMGSGHMGAGHTAAEHMSAGHMGAEHMGAGHMGSDAMSQSAHAMDGTSSLGMLAAHLLAALLCGLWLAYGERAAFRILRAVAGRLAAPLRLLLALPTPPHRPRIRVRRGSCDRSPRRFLLVHAITSRGPPMGSAAS